MKSTDCVHAGKIIDEKSKGMVTPVYPSTSFDYIETELLAYPRYFNTPNQKVVVDKLCRLEHAEAGFVTSSGMSAISTIIYGLMKQGDHAVFQRDLYGGTYSAVVNELEKFGIEYTFTGTEQSEIEAAIKPNTRILYFESPSNPLLRIADIGQMVEVARSHDLVTVIDNTFASPINQNPIALGVDIVLHSGTKYLGGHSDICCGAILTSADIADKIRDTAVHLGGSVNAQTCYLLERSLKTLAIRVQRQNENAMTIASHLAGHDRIKTVNYPGLESHNDHEIAGKQMSGYGGMMSFEPDLAQPQLDKFLKSLNVIHSAMSLGGVETIISSPSRTSHAKMNAQQRSEAGISDELLRMSVGIEESGDLIEDLDQALSAV